MTTRELAHNLVAEARTRYSVEEAEAAVYRHLLLFLVDHKDGYGANEGERGAARAYAANHGYFWLPCILCGQWRGGHEPGTAGVMLTKHEGVGVCNSPECASEARRLNRRYKGGLKNVIVEPPPES